MVPYRPKKRACSPSGDTRTQGASRPIKRKTAESWGLFSEISRCPHTVVTELDSRFGQVYFVRSSAFIPACSHIPLVIFPIKPYDLSF